MLIYLNRTICTIVNTVFKRKRYIILCSYGYKPLKHLTNKIKRISSELKEETKITKEKKVLNQTEQMIGNEILDKWELS